ncbi:MAG TPA: glycosyl hydrolase 115 family protein [Vicinamibacterales bacterium]|nr:glycosyl hydrolase 115 family protein [Vicinamibacterales bacterium]
MIRLMIDLGPAGRLNARTLCVAAALAIACGGSASAGQAARGRTADGPLVLDRATTIVVGAEEPGPVLRAAQDLAADFEKVLGQPPRIVRRAEEAGPSSVVIGYRSPLVQSLRSGGGAAPESFSLSVKSVAWSGTPRHRVVLLTGADMRGTMYAVYQFAEELLGVDPLYYWTDRVPPRRSSIDVPASLDRTFAAPVFKYRGFFINDEDLLTGWAPGERTDHTGISLAVWDKIYETTLRLKGNIVAPGTWIFPDEPQIAKAGERGLIVTQHHAIPLGVNVARWPENTPYSYGTHPEILQRAWKNAVMAYPRDQEILWTVGLRGLSDSSYAVFDPTVGTDSKALGRVIGKAMADQVSLVRSIRPDASFITNLWQEGARLVQQGDLEIPPGVNTVWADDGYGNLQDAGRVAAGNGAYYHVAMMNTRANQLTEMVPVERIYAELGRYIAARATHYLLVNTSDIRPVPMTIRAVMDAAWKGVPEGGAGAATEFYRQWSADQFGAGAAATVANVYQEYFKTPPRTTVGGATREYGDQLYHTEARRMLTIDAIDWPLYTIASQAPPWVPLRRVEIAGPGGAPVSLKEWVRTTAKTESEICSEAQPRWDALWQKAHDAEAAVAADRRPFYRAHVLTMIAINRSSNQMLLQVSKALQAVAAGNLAQARELLAKAMQACDEIRKAEAAAEYGPWKNWYAGDWLTNVGRTRQVIESYVQHLDDPIGPMPSLLTWEWEAYYHIMHYEGTRAVDVR